MGVTTRSTRAILAGKIREVSFTPLRQGAGPAEFEALKEECIRRMQLNADECRAAGMLDLEQRALVFIDRMNPATRMKVDVTANQLGLVKGPDLTGLTDEELKRLEMGEHLADKEKLS